MGITNLWPELQVINGAMTTVNFGALITEAVCVIDVSFLIHKWARIHKRYIFKDHDFMPIAQSVVSDCKSFKRCNLFPVPVFDAISYTSIAKGYERLSRDESRASAMQDLLFI